MTDKNPHKPFRLVLSFAGGKYDLRVQAHEKDPALLVVKSGNPEALDNLIIATGINPEVAQRFKGEVYNIAFVPKENMAKLLAAVLINGLATKAEAQATLAVESMGEADDDVGGDDDSVDD